MPSKRFKKAPKQKIKAKQTLSEAKQTFQKSTEAKNKATEAFQKSTETKNKTEQTNQKNTEAKTKTTQTFFGHHTKNSKRQNNKKRLTAQVFKCLNALNASCLYINNFYAKMHVGYVHFGVLFEKCIFFFVILFFFICGERIGSFVLLFAE